MPNHSVIKYFAALQLLALSVFGQLQTNYELINGLVSESVTNLYNNTEDMPSQVELSYVSPADYSVFNNTVIGSLQNSGVEVVEAGTDTKRSALNYTLSQIYFVYEDSFKDGWFGGLYVKRYAEIKGSYSFESDGKREMVNEFMLSKTDTVEYDLVSQLESSSYPFTNAELPPEPFLSGIWEPIIALGAAVVTVILFFSVRSK